MKKLRHFGKQLIENNINKKRIYFLVALLSFAILLAFFYMGVGVWNEYTYAIMDNQKQQLLVTSRSLAKSLEASLKAYQTDLQFLVSLTLEKERSESNQQLIEQLERDYLAVKPEVYSLLWEDENGNTIESSRDMEVTQIYSETEFEKGNKLEQVRLSDGDIYLFLKQELDVGGSFCIVIDSAMYYNELISDIRVGSNGYIVVKDSKGTILMHPQEAQWGIDVIAGRQDIYPDIDLSSLEQLIEEQLRGEEGISEYYSYWWMQPDLPRVRKIAAYAPVTIENDFLVVSAVMDYDDVYIPVAEGFLKLILVFSGVLILFLLLALTLGWLLLQKKKNTEEILYLRELNGVLEEMHHSEERVAHQQRLQVMGTMTGGIAHEFNNLLTPIMGYADLMLAELPEGSELYDNAEEIYGASAKAKDIIQQLSSLSRKNIETVYRNLPARGMITRGIKMMKSICPSHIDLREDLNFRDESILGNETQMNQVFLNICVNAIHAIEQNQGVISVTGVVVGKEEVRSFPVSDIPDTWNRYIKIDIRDNGCGMSPDILKQIFSPFFTTKTHDQGTGLGLALVEQIIQSHRGYIFAESEVGKGSVFHIYLPVNEKTEWEIDSLPKMQNQKLKLLIADDNAKILQLLKKSFKRLDVQIVTCMNQEEALNLLRQQSFNVLVMDINLADVSGIDFCMAIQGQYPKMQKIIMVDLITKEIIEAKQKGIIDDYIERPVSDITILEKIKKRNS